jgi:CheY-like chemotaxis protein
MDEFLLAPLLASEPIRDAIDFCNPLASISNVNIVMNCCGNTAEAFVNANALRLQQVLINMISNAIKYTGQGTAIRVSTRSSTIGDCIVSLRKAIACCPGYEDRVSSGAPEISPVLVFSVSDSGPGIAIDQTRRLFRRFTRLSQQPARTLGSNMVGQPSGTGLGLHLCQMFIQRMKGWVWVDNNSNGEGSTFSFCLPVVQSPDVPRRQSPTFVPDCIRPGAEPPLSRAGHSSLRTNDYRKLRVLVVDDTLINRKVLDRMLKKIGVCKVSTMESGESALMELFSSGKTYDLVISDLQMPGMSGTELTEEIFRKRQQLEQVKLHEGGVVAPIPSLVVVGLTADMSPGIAEKCAACGMSDLLYKPITLVEIKEYFLTKVGTLQPGKWRHL